MASFHTKYRPAKFSDLDQKRVRDFFGASVLSGNVANSYLFAGPKGTGKTSAARILARALNCELNVKALEKWRNGEVGSPGKLSEPCGSCDSCVSIESGGSTAVVEIDGASNRGIDDVRVLRENVRLMPGDGLFSVFIIDEVHMLTREAFNALLKTLEEPPRHVVFCLATTEKHKLPETVISRCSLVEYQKATVEEIISSMQRVVDGEKIKIDKEQMLMIAEQADGSFRDASVMLAQLASLDKKITTDLIEESLGVVSTANLDKFIDHLAATDLNACMASLSSLEAAGVDASQLIRSLASRVRVRLLDSLDDEQALTTYKKVLEGLSRAYSRLSQVPIPFLAMELSVLEQCLEGRPIAKSVAQAAVAPKKVVSTPVVESKKKAIKPEVSEPKAVVEEESAVEESVEVLDNSEEPVLAEGAFEFEMSQVHGLWDQILADVSEKNRGLVTLMKRCRPIRSETSRLVVSVGYSFHKEQLEQLRYLEIIEPVISERLGGNVRLGVELVEPKKSAVSEVSNISGQVADEDAKLVGAVEEAFGL